MAKIILQRSTGDFGFVATDENGHQIQTDTSKETGGNDFGFRPMQMLLAALGSCSAIDIVIILHKQRQVINDFKMEINGEREENVIPSLWKQVHIDYYLSGEIDIKKANKAAQLSMDKYCSVAETLRRSGTNITWQVHLNSSSS